MSHLDIAFAPTLPWPLLAGLGALALALTVLGAMRRAPGTALRALAALLLLGALAGPRLRNENRTPLPDVALVLVDQSPSQRVGDRPAQTAEAVAALTEKLKHLPDLELRIEEVRAESGPDRGTRMFEAAERALADVPRRRLGGVVMITDGRVHDVPADHGRSLGAPLHVLLTGAEAERDRRMAVTAAPAFGLVGETAPLTFRVEENGAKGETRVTIRLDGRPFAELGVPLNREARIDIPLRHAGANVVELETEGAEGELSTVNNRTALTISGVRNRLKVLLVSGEPHAGERTWRNLLKSDPAVDLVHFTILRPPEKDDQTPIREMSLISFPVRELFEDRLSEFDLVIFDRYRRRGVLSAAYYRNLARYVREGGALLAAVGPEFAEEDGIGRSPLAEILPAAPTGRRLDVEFRPTLTEEGRRHPVMAGLPGTRPGDPLWGGWMRRLEVGPTRGTVLLTADEGKPLVILDRVEEGRVAMVLSDTLWLWARGWEGGGPHAEMMRRLAHWLMKEPDLEEEALTAAVEGGVLRVIARGRTALEAVTVVAPDGAESRLPLAVDGEGSARGEMPVEGAGLWRVTAEDGRVALAAAGDPRPLELSELTATADILAPSVAATGGSLTRLRDGIPEFRRAAAPSPGRPVLLERGDHLVDGLRDTPLVAAFVILLAALGIVVAAWRNESK